MKRTIMLMSVVLMLTGVSSAALLVDTNFNWDSAGAGTWKGDWNGNADLASGIAWYSNYTSNDSHKAGYAPITDTTHYERQIGWVKGKTGAKSYSSLVIGSGQNTGIYKATWFEAVNDRSSTQPNKVGYSTFSATGGLTAVEVKMDDTNHNIYVASAAGDILLTSLTNNLWYEFELTMDFVTGKFDISVKEEGASGWAATQSGLDFVNSAAGSFDRIELSVAAHDSAYGYQFINGYDDFKVDVVPEPATMALLGLGGFMALRRRSR